MKLKALLLALFVAGFSASFALADDGGHGKGKGGSDDAQAAVATTHGAKAKPCRPRLELELRGTVASASDSSLALAVTKGRAQGAKLDGTQLTLDLSHAHVRGTLVSGGTVRAHARACVDLAAGTVTLVATQVKAGPAKDDDGGDGTTSTTTTTTAG